jgi:hypothetical protein
MVVTVFKFIGAAIALIVGFGIWRIFATIKGSHLIHARLQNEVRPVRACLERKESPSQADVDRLARDPRTRATLYETLREHKRADLMPAAYATQQALAESRLVTWLMHPNELAAAPDEITLGAEVALPDADAKDERWLVYRFRTMAPHWASQIGWMAGVVGPVRSRSEPTPDVPVVFSRLPHWDSATPEGHAAAVRDLMRQKGLVV